MTNDRKSAIAAHFDTAHRYNDAARVQKRCADHLAQRISAHLSQHTKHRILELGCGTGFLSAHLLARFPHATVCATDLSSAMLNRAKDALGHENRILFQLMDGEHPNTNWKTPHTPPFDLITSNLCWQWFADRPGALQRLCALLKPGGYIILSTLLEQSLHEWRDSCVSTNTACGVPQYPSRAQLEHEWPCTGTGQWHEEFLSDPVPSARVFLQELRQIGASLPRLDHQPAQGLSLRRAMRWFDNRHHTVCYHVGYGIFQKDKV